MTWDLRWLIAIDRMLMTVQITRWVSLLTLHAYVALFNVPFLAYLAIILPRRNPHGNAHRFLAYCCALTVLISLHDVLVVLSEGGYRPWYEASLPVQQMEAIRDVVVILMMCCYVLGMAMLREVEMATRWRVAGMLLMSVLASLLVLVIFYPTMTFMVAAVLDSLVYMGLLAGVWTVYRFTRTRDPLELKMFYHIRKAHRLLVPLLAVVMVIVLGTNVAVVTSRLGVSGPITLFLAPFVLFKVPYVVAALIAPHVGVSILAFYFYQSIPDLKQLRHHYVTAVVSQLPPQLKGHLHPMIDHHFTELFELFVTIAQAVDGGGTTPYDRPVSHLTRVVEVIRDLTVGVIMGSFTDAGMTMRAMSTQCPIRDQTVVATVLDFSMFLYQKGSANEFYGPYPLGPWHVMSVVVLAKDEHLHDPRIKDLTQAVLALVYPKRHQALMALQRHKVERCLLKWLHGALHDLSRLDAHLLDKVAEDVLMTLLSVSSSS